MAKTTVLKADGAKGASVELADGLFGAPVNTALIHQAAVRQLAGRRVGTADTQTRAEVRGGGRKPWRQKGTGRARQGSRRAPQWAGGGVVFGPHPRAYDQKMNTKMRRAALRGVLSAKAADGALRVVEGFGLDEIGTRAFAERLTAWEAGGKVLVVLAARDHVVERSCRNLREVRVLLADSLNVDRPAGCRHHRLHPRRADARRGGVRVTATSMHDILLRPVISEKSVMETERNNYTFAVARDANKLQIKQAVEAEFKVNVLGVRVLTVKPKQKRRGRRQMGTVPGWRKAVVTIADGQKIEFFETV